MSKRYYTSSGAPWEETVGYSRAVKVGNVIEVSGTAPVKDGKPFTGSPYEQAKCCLEIIAEHLQRLDSGMEDVVRTRMFVTDISQWEEFGRAHAEFLGDYRPATSMVEVSKLIDEGILIEIEATAVLGGNIISNYLT
ncbi:MAG: RidA family protein [Bacteroidota bacterium]